MSKGNFLQEELRRFREQQRTAQSRVSSAKAKQAKPRSRVKPETGTTGLVTAGDDEKPHWSQLVSQATAAPLQRHVPQALGLKLKRLLDCLLQEEVPLSPDELKQKTGISIEADEGLLEALKENPKAKFDNGKYQYQSQYQVKNEADLLLLLDKNPEGLYLSELKDAYKEVVKDLRMLATKERVWILQNADNKEEVVYPIDPRLVVSLDQDLIQIWRDVPVPEHDDGLLQELHKVGLKPCARQSGPTMKRADKKDEHKEKVRKLRSVTNAHVAEIFKDDLVNPGNNVNRKRKER